MARAIMVQGTASHVGKSIVAAGLCRVFANRGVSVAPFKSQNMSLNSCVTADGGEIARAQELMARGARVEPSVLMNPVLLKPKDNRHCEVLALGRAIGDFSAMDYAKKVRPQVLETISDSLARLGESYDLIVIEGAGSPAEINLRKYDICNMKVARMAGAPVLLVADIDAGGALAAVVGTLALLTPKERDLVKGIVINKFRGDMTLLEPGLDILEKKTGKKVLGVIPYIDCSYLDEEDTMSDHAFRPGAEIAIVRLPYTSNFTDFEPIARAGRVSWVRRPAELDGARVIILPGTRNTLLDLQWLKDTGMAPAIKEKAASGAAVIGICGGYQMLGERLEDPDGVEAQPGSHEGLGLLPLTVTFERPKRTNQVAARVVRDISVLPGLEGQVLSGFEIHTGRALVEGDSQPLAFESREGTTSDGAARACPNVFGTHLHGLFNNRHALEALFRFLGLAIGPDDYNERADSSLEALASTIEESIDMDYICGLAGIE
jgi:adenosylcobyric acid synthase